MKINLARGLLLSALALLSLSSAHAGIPVESKMKCPVGGKTFTHTTTASLSKWGSRPDGKPYGSWEFPIPLPECPDNGLVVYRDFSKDEVKTLKTLLATPEYLQLRQAATPYYRAYWLMGKLDEPLDDQLWLLQQASWQSDQDLARKQRYQEEFVQRSQGFARPAPPQDDLLWIVMKLRAVNALRELGRFDDALALLDSVPLASLDVTVPAEKVSGTTASGYGKYIENSAEIRAAEQRRGWLGFSQGLRTVIQRHDSASEPFDMLPVRVAAELCAEKPPSVPEYKQICDSEQVRKLIERAR